MRIECKNVVAVDMLRMVISGVCKEYGCNFTNTKLRGCSPEMKALAVLPYSMGKSSFRWLEKLFKVAHTSVYKWIILYTKKLPRPPVPNQLREVEIDEMWNFIDSKKTNYGFGKHIKQGV